MLDEYISLVTCLDLSFIVVSFFNSKLGWEVAPDIPSHDACLLVCILLAEHYIYVQTG
jgi:hypothetical protein